MSRASVMGTEQTDDANTYKCIHSSHIINDAGRSDLAVACLTAVPRSTQPSTLCGTVNEYQLSG